MANSFDFGFTAVDQDELTTKTGEAAALNEKIAEDLKKVAESSKGAVNSEQIENLDAKVDVLNKLVSNALDELDDAKTSMGSSTDVAVSKLKSSLADAEEPVVKQIDGWDGDVPKTIKRFPSNPLD